MKRLFWVFAFILLIPPSLFAQFSIIGTTKDNSKKTIPFVNISLINSKDSVLIKATSGDDKGNFVFEKVNAGNYKLVCTAIGYEKFYSVNFDLKADIKDFSTVLNESASKLKEVQISVKRPFIEQLIDKTVVNVAGSINAAGGNALDVLAKAPGVTIDYQNDVIQLRGKEGVIIQIDGKQTYMSAKDAVSVLRGMASDNIDKIELITNPSAKYDAAGNSGIINIKLKKNNLVGTNGSLTLSAGTGKLDKERVGVQLNHRVKKANIFGSYNFNRLGNYWNFSLDRDQPNASLTDLDRRNIVAQTTFIENRETGHNTKAGLDYFIDSKTTIGLAWTGFWQDKPENGPASTWFSRTDNGPVYLRIETNKSISSVMQNQLGNINIQHNFGDKQGVFSADIDAGRFNKDFSNYLSSETLISTERPAVGTEILFTTMPTVINIFTAKTDYSGKISKLNFETGFKFADIKTDNDLQIGTGTPTNVVSNPALSNHFQYTEKVIAGYINLSGKLFKKVDFQMGLRAEQTHSIGNSITLNQEVTRNYLKFFPSVFVTSSVANNQTLTLSYSYRIDRPDYQSLNPSRSYIDPYSYSVGNSYLKPQFTHAFELRHSFKDGLNSSLAINLAKDLVQKVNYVADGNQSFRIAQNIGNSEGFTLTLSYPITISKAWQIQTSAFGYYNKLHFQYNGVELEAENIASRLSINNSFKLQKGWTAELNSWVTTPKTSALSKISWSGTVDLGMQKAVSNSFKLKLSLQDIFHTINVRDVGIAPDSYQIAKMNFDTRVALLSLSYNFGNQQMKGNRQRKTGSEDETKRTTGN